MLLSANVASRTLHFGQARGLSMDGSAILKCPMRRQASPMPRIVRQQTFASLVPWPDVDAMHAGTPLALRPR